MSVKEVPRADMPALAKQPSTRPWASSVSAKRLSTSASLVTSQTRAVCVPPALTSFSRARASAFFSALRPQMQTSPPAIAMASPKPRPMPPLPPVIRATLPLRSKGV